jgi:hypothetical protein
MRSSTISASTPRPRPPPSVDRRDVSAMPLIPFGDRPDVSDYGRRSLTRSTTLPRGDGCWPSSALPPIAGLPHRRFFKASHRWVGRLPRRGKLYQSTTPARPDRRQPSGGSTRRCPR